jgi:hypothetical protein
VEIFGVKVKNDQKMMGFPKGHARMIFGKELEISEKRETRKEKKTSYEENPGFPFSKNLPNIIPA